MEGYGIREFAALAGVTVKALRHYDRIGLLTPGRTAAGYRRYSTPDLGRVEQISVLRVLGLPLREIRTIVAGDAAPLRAFLVREREALERKRAALDRAIAALPPSDAPAAASVDDLIAAIGIPEADLMRRYFSDEAWAQGQAHFADWPPPPWRALFR